MWIDVSLLVAYRAMDKVDEAQRLTAMLELAAVLTQCGSAALVASSAARRDILADAALRLWHDCVPAITRSDAEACAQQDPASSGPVGLPATLRLAAGGKDVGNQLQISLTPKSKADGAKLATALGKMRKTDPHFSYTVVAKSGVIVVNGSGELHLQTICDKAKIDSGAECVAGPVLSPSVTHAAPPPLDGSRPGSPRPGRRRRPAYGRTAGRERQDPKAQFRRAVILGRKVLYTRPCLRSSN